MSERCLARFYMREHYRRDLLYYGEGIATSGLITAYRGGSSTEGKLGFSEVDLMRFCDFDEEPNYLTLQIYNGTSRLIAEGHV